MMPPLRACYRRIEHVDEAHEQKRRYEGGTRAHTKPPLSIGHRFGPAAGVKTTNGWERGTTAPISFEQNSPPRAIEKSFFCGAVLPRGQGKGRRPPITASSKTLK